jgi:D-ribitol-5-phosphate cytidylyltransferase
MNIAIILAAGSGLRMGSNIPKQFINVNNKPLMIYPLETFSICEEIDEIIIVTSKQHINEVKGYISQFNITKVKDVIEGGLTRQESVFNALTYLKNNNVNPYDNILIHDSARVLVSNEIIKNNINALTKYNAVDSVLPMTDSCIQSLDGTKITSLLKRSELYLSQTPQSFKFNTIYKAHENIKNLKNFEITDDCSLVLKMNEDVYLVEGSKLNFKVTTKEDLLLLESLLKK